MEKINGNTDSFMYGYLCTTGEPLKRPSSNKVAWHPSCRLNTIHVPGVTLPNISSMLPTPRPTPLNSPMPRKKLTPKKTTPKCKKAILSNEPSPVPAPSTPERGNDIFFIYYDYSQFSLCENRIFFSLKNSVYLSI